VYSLISARLGKFTEKLKTRPLPVVLKQSYILPRHMVTMTTMQTTWNNSQWNTIC
jgi:hypothetical protein